MFFINPFQVLRLLLVAWDRRLIFSVGTSSTTGESDTVIWNEVHHKTEFGSNLTGHGYPDPGHLDNVLEELKAQGITEEECLPRDWAETFTALKTQEDTRRESLNTILGRGSAARRTSYFQNVMKRTEETFTPDDGEGLENKTPNRNGVSRICCDSIFFFFSYDCMSQFWYVRGESFSFLMQ